MRNMEEDSKKEDVFRPCKCNISYAISSGMYVTAILAAGVLFIMMSVDKNVQGKCRFMAFLNISKDDITIDEMITEVYCNDAYDFIMVVLLYSTASVILHFCFGCQGKQWWSMLQSIVGLVLTIMLIMYSSLIVIQLYYLCESLGTYDGVEFWFKGCHERVREYDIKHNDKMLQMSFYMSSLTIVAITAWALAFIWCGIFLLHLSKACAMIQSARLKNLKQKLEHKEVHRIKDFNKNLNSRYNYTRSEKTPLMEKYNFPSTSKGF